MVFSQIERALIEGQWPANTTTTSEMETSVKASIDGEYATVLQSSASRRRLQVAQGFLSGAPLKQSLILEHGPLSSKEEELFTLILAATCLRAFAQLNWTGPDVPIRSSQILTNENNSPLDISDDELNRRCVGELTYSGEPAYHRAKSTAFLIIAKSLLSREYVHVKSVAWWRLRAEYVHQQLLDEVVAVPDGYFVDIENLEKEMEHSEQDKDLIGRLLLEKGLLRHLLHLDKLAREDFTNAARVMELKYELTGALGKRTKFQQGDVAQLVLLAESRSRADDPSIASTSVEAVPSLPETLELNDDTLLERTEFTSSAPADSSSPLPLLDLNSQPALHPLDQCILLGLCLNIKNTSPQHGLTTTQMSPYIARVISHPVNWSVHTMALLLRSRLEANRTRTVERSTLQLQALIDQMPTSDSTPQERLAYLWGIGLPSSWEMEREVAKRYASLGVVKSAMEIFERLEMWEEVVQCWQVLERPDKGLEIVRDLLEGRKEEVDEIVLRGKEAKRDIKPALDRAREAKLWCLLGELESERAVEHYEKAWEVSGHTSGRAMRSLGGYWFTRGEFDRAIDCLKRATTINPLYSRSWFILGCACLREERLEEARDAFIRCVSIDDEDSESWNNLASAYLRMGFSNQPYNPLDVSSISFPCSFTLI
jgi:tetratricopeptide (TPR) repeat protein